MKKLRTASRSSAVRALSLLAAVMTSSAALAVNEGLTFYEDGKSAEKGTDVKSGFTINASETKDPKKIDWAQRADRGGTANVTVYQDGKGNPIAIFVVGVSQVNPALKAIGSTIAEENAKSAAERKAKAALAFYLNGGPELFVKTAGHKEITVTGSSVGVKDGKTETNVGHSGQVIDGAGWESSQLALLQSRGLSVYGGGIVGDKCIRILRWTAEGQKLAEKAEKIMRGGSEDDGDSQKDNDGVSVKTPQGGAQVQEEMPKLKITTQDDD